MKIDIQSSRAQKIIRAAYTDAYQQCKLSEDGTVIFSVEEIADRIGEDRSFVDAVLRQIFAPEVDLQVELNGA